MKRSVKYTIPLKLLSNERTFLPPHSLAKPLSCRLLDMFHKETKCSKLHGPSMNLKVRQFKHGMFDCFENFAIRKRECYFCFASISANRQALINKPAKQISALVQKEYGSKKERRVRRTLRKPCHNPFEGTSGVY